MPEMITKRRNPFEKPKEESKPVTQPKVEEKPIIEEEETVENTPVEEVFEEFPEEEVEEVETYVAPVQVQPQVVRKPAQQKPAKNTKKPVYVQPDEEQREKFTSTMEVTLRRRIKIVCAMRGIMFSEFIEQACAEKLAREGER